MKKLDQNTLFAIFGIILFIGFLVYIYNQGRKKGTITADIGDDYVRPGFSPAIWVTDGNYLLTNWSVWATQAEKRTDYLKRLNQLSDGELKTVYNAYNDRFFIKDNKTFVQVIKDATVSTLFEQNPKTLILDRFTRMQLA